jgi:hypothetical protein
MRAVGKSGKEEVWKELALFYRADALLDTKKHFPLNLSAKP